MEELAKEGIETLVLDITSDESIASAKDEIAKRTGGSLDILVNNAQVAPQSTLFPCTRGCLPDYLDTLVSVGRYPRQDSR